MPDNKYQKQAGLLLRILPYVMREDVFVLKGGTAINFFWRDYLRLSVDIDLTYLKIQDRDLSLLDISDRLASIEGRIQRTFPGVITTQKQDTMNRLIYGLIIQNKEAIVKIEVNTVIRGAVYPPSKKKLCAKAEELYELTLSAKTLSFEDLYGGKICAALDRQHPRDLFDIKILLDNEGLTDKIVKAFIFYLISHNRPMIEVLNPGLQNIEQVYDNEFKGMTSNEISLETLLNVRSTLIQKIKTLLTDEQKAFLLSFKNMKPEWELSAIEGLERYPSVRWKLINLKRMDKMKHQMAYDKLKEYLLE